MQYDIISTGSKGNAVFLNGGILIDCGVPFKKLEPVIRDIKLVLLTHIHGDHFNIATIKRIAVERPTVRFVCGEWLVKSLAAIIPKRQIDVVKMNCCYAYKGIATIRPTALTHDVPNCGWHIWPGDESVFYATDTGTLNGITARDYDLYMVEANHTVEDIERRAAEKQERGEYSYEVRAAANHLSEEQALDWILRNQGPKSEFVLLHQHEGGESDA